MLRRDDKVCLFKIADGTLIFSETRCIEDDGVTFDMETSWMVVTSTKDSQTDVKLFSGRELIFRPKIMYFPWTSIIMASDAEETAREMFKTAVLGVAKPTETAKKGLRLDKKD